MSLEVRLGYNSMEKFIELYKEYINSILEENVSTESVLSAQNYQDEIENLSRLYGLPDGRIYIAYYEDQLAGCVALKKLDDERCEMKRLYVKKEFRNKHIGNYLIWRIIKDAREIGYKYLLLDTMPFMETAINAYENVGFERIDKYYETPVDDLIFLKLEL